MPTPAVNTQTSRYVPHSYVVFNRFTGAIVYQGHMVHSRVEAQQVRPKSVSMPRRSDRTRGNSPWEHRWARTSEIESMFSDYSGTESEIVSRGQLLYAGHLGPPDTSRVDSLMRNARLAALAKGSSAVKQSNAALRQAKDLVGMAKEYTRRAAKGLDNLWQKKGWRKAAGPASSWKELPSDYLAYLYGIAPLGDDIANCLDQLDTMKNYGMKMTMVLRASKKLTEARTAYNAVFHGTGTRGIRYQGTGKTGVRVAYRFDLPDWFMDNVPVIAPFSTQYELARYSFVLDWFLPVGDYIGALESAQFSPYFVEGWEVWKCEDVYDLSSAECTNGINPRIRMRGRAVNGMTRRTVVSEYPSSVLTRPALNPIPGVNQVSQGLSLLAQRLQRMR